MFGRSKKTNKIAWDRKANVDVIKNKHWAPDSNWNLKEKYAKELKKMIPDVYYIQLVRKILEEGPEVCADGVKTNLETLAVISALLLSIVLSAGEVDTDQCSYSDFTQNACNIQFRCAWFAIASCLIEICVCTFNVAVLNFSPDDELAYIL